MRRGKSAGEKQAAIEAPHAVGKQDVFAVQDVRRRRLHFCGNEEIAGFDFLNAYAAQRSAPFVSYFEIVSADDLEIRREIEARYIRVSYLHAQAKKRVLFAIRYPAL